jgi:probable biosynthetic protein (TIGR04098 family)
MLTETIELTMSHVSLGRLNEFALMTLFGNAHSRRLTLDTRILPREIADAAGNLLYPSYYLTHLRVPADRLLRRFQVWDKLSVGVDVHTFGGILLESKYAAGAVGEVPQQVDTWQSSGLASMHAGNAIVIDGKPGEPQPAVPKPGMIATLPKLREAPKLLERFRGIVAQGVVDPTFVGPLKHQSPIAYSLEHGRDLAQGHGVMFANFVLIMDHAERVLLSELIWPRFSKPLVDCLATLERETCYVGNVRGEQTLQIGIQAKLSPCPENFHGDSRDIVSGGLLEASLQVCDGATNSLLVTSKVKKLLAIPTDQQSLVTEAKRLVFQHAGVS